MAWRECEELPGLVDELFFRGRFAGLVCSICFRWVHQSWTNHPSSSHEKLFPFPLVVGYNELGNVWNERKRNQQFQSLRRGKEWVQESLSRVNSTMPNRNRVTQPHCFTSLFFGTLNFLEKSGFHAFFFSVCSSRVLIKTKIYFHNFPSTNDYFYIAAK